MSLLNACKTINSNYLCSNFSLPDMPLPGKNVGNELEQLCKPLQKCKNLEIWLNDLYKFKEIYMIYKLELSK